MGLKMIFQEGMKEKRRRKSMRSGTKLLKDKQGLYSVLLTALGQKAWESDVALDAFGELKATLNETKMVLDQLQARTAELERQKQQAESDEKRELDRLAAGQKELEESKRDADSRLNSQKNAMLAAQKEAAQSRNRLGAISQEQTQLEVKKTDASASEAEKIEFTAIMSALSREARELEARAREREETGKNASERIAPLQEESGRLQKAIDDARAEGKRVVSEADKKIAALASELSVNNIKRKEAEKTQALNFNRLGENLAASQSKAPGIAREIAAVQGAQAEMDGMQSLLGGLERQKDEAQVSAYRKMTAILIGAAVVVAAILVLLFILLAPGKKENPLSGLSGPIGSSAKGLETRAKPVSRSDRSRS